jgi:hypothetical protein
VFDIRRLNWFLYCSLSCAPDQDRYLATRANRAVTSSGKHFRLEGYMLVFVYPNQMSEVEPPFEAGSSALNSASGRNLGILESGWLRRVNASFSVNHDPKQSDPSFYCHPTHRRPSSSVKMVQQYNIMGRKVGSHYVSSTSSRLAYGNALLDSPLGACPAPITSH